MPSAERRYTLTLDDIVAFAQEGWEWPLEDNEETRREIVRWLRERAIASTDARDEL